MRLSSIPKSPFYSKLLVTRAQVYLNGLLVSPVVEFDEEVGWVVLAIVGDDGKTIPWHESPVGLRCRKYRGTVQCVLRKLEPNASAALVHPDWLLEEPPTP